METDLGMKQILELADKDFTTVIILVIGKYAPDELKNKESQQTVRNYNKEPNENYEIKIHNI